MKVLRGAEALNIEAPMNNSLSRILKAIKPLDRKAMAAARVRQDELTKPKGSLGRLEELSIKIAGIKGEIIHGFEHKAIVTMAADHGVVSEGVTLHPQEVTRQMVFNFLNGGAGINVLARFIGARVVVVDVGTAGDFSLQPNLVCRKVAYGTKNMVKQAAMTRREAMKSIEAGIDVVEDEIAKGLDIVGTGDMGIGNTTASSAICAAIMGESVEKVTGRGEGLGDEQLAHKVEVIQRALELNKPNPRDPVDVLSKVGGFEIGGLAGVMLAAAAHRVPVVIDGFISGAAALIATELSPGLKDYLIAAHLSAESGHAVLLQYLGLTPLLSLEMRLGEGTGAALGIVIVEAAVKTLAEMATFGEAGVTQAEENLSP
jgi:nicotinate-nucleotide--dimethylbenzimidazole phosphoribosyltransferase